MDDARARAYRRLLYWAMLDLRAHVPTSPYFRERWWSPRFWLEMRRKHYYNMDVADWLHNLAQFAADNIDWLDERIFWEEWDRLKQRHPNDGLGDYRRRFEQELSSQLARGE